MKHDDLTEVDKLVVEIQVYDGLERHGVLANSSPLVDILASAIRRSEKKYQQKYKEDFVSIKRDYNGF